MLKISLGFADVYYKKEDKEIKDAIKAVKEAYAINKKFYGQRISKFNVRFVYSRKDFNKSWGGKTETWQVAFADANRVILFPNRLIKKYSQ